MISIINLLINIWNIYSIIVKKNKNQPNDLIHLMVMRFIKEKNKNIEVISKIKKNWNKRSISIEYTNNSSLFFVSNLIEL